MNKKGRAAMRFDRPGGDGELSELSLYVYLVPHLHHNGQENEAWSACGGGVNGKEAQLVIGCPGDADWHKDCKI